MKKCSKINGFRAFRISQKFCFWKKSAFLGKFTDATYGSLVHLVTWLMGRYDLTTDDVIRHYDVTGKACPKYYVENEAAWEQFKSDLVDYIETNGIAKTEEIQ